MLACRNYMPMRLRFREDRTTQAAGRLLRKAGGRLPHISLIKLLYLADRRALLELGRPISFDRYASLPHGPVLSRTLDLISSEPLPEEPSYWRDYISAPDNYEVELVRETPNDQLSPAEEAILDAVFAEFGGMTRWELVRFAHTLPEWRDPQGSSTPIPMKSVLLHQGVSEEDAEAILGDLAAASYAERILG